MVQPLTETFRWLFDAHKEAGLISCAAKMRQTIVSISENIRHNYNL